MGGTAGLSFGQACVPTWDQAPAIFSHMAERLITALLIFFLLLNRLYFEACLEFFFFSSSQSHFSILLRFIECSPKAKEHGFGMVGTFNTSTSTGSIGYYAKTIADAGLIAFCFAQSPEVRTNRTSCSKQAVVVVAMAGPQVSLRLRAEQLVVACGKQVWCVFFFERVCSVVRARCCSNVF